MSQEDVTNAPRITEPSLQHVVFVVEERGLPVVEVHPTEEVHPAEEVHPVEEDHPAEEIHP